LVFLFEIQTPSKHLKPQFEFVPWLIRNYIKNAPQLTILVKIHYKFDKFNKVIWKLIKSLNVKTHHLSNYLEGNLAKIPLKSK